MYALDHFIIVEGIDGCGKGTIVEKLSRYLSEKESLIMYDLRKHPKTEINADILISAEPTYFETGLKIRKLLKEIKNYDKPTIDQLADFFSKDRLFLYNEVLIPFLNRGGYVIQERSVISSLVYQGFEYVGLIGNKNALSYPATVIILDVDPEIAIERLNNRSKQDNAYFEKLDFLKKIKEIYLSKRLNQILSTHGFQVFYVNNNSNLENTFNRIKEYLKL